MSASIFVGTDNDGARQKLLLNKANRHGLIAGATGTGKTVTLQILTEGFSKAGVPVFAADVKGDLSGLSQAGTERHKLHKKLLARAAKIGLEDYHYSAMPTIFWDLYAKKGHPVRATLTEMGPVLLSRLMNLNATQEGIMIIAFEICDNEQMLLLDLKDLRAMLNYISDHRADISREYGNVAPQSIAAIMRSLLVLEREGADAFFAEPALKLEDIMRVDDEGRGLVSILAADDLINSPKLYCTFLLWLLSELFEELPEIGNPDKPVMVFFFDEAHLLFDGAPKVLVDKIEQVARLIRSKGVGIYFVTQNPMDIPDSVLGQLGNRIQHALRAYTPKEQKAVRAAASSFRVNPKLDTEAIITDLGVGEALVSLLDEKGVPSIVSRTLVRPPASRLGPATKAQRAAIIEQSPVRGLYDEMVDRESAYEILAGKTEAAAKQTQSTPKKASKKSAKTPSKKSSGRQSIAEAAIKSGARSIASSIGRQIAGPTGAAVFRGILGAIMRR